MLVLKNSAQKETVVALQNGGKRLRVPIMHTRDRKRNEKCTMMDKKMKSSQWKKRSTVHKEEKKKRPIVLNKEITSAQCVLRSVRCPCIFYGPVVTTIRRRGGYRGILIIMGETMHHLEFKKSQKCGKMYFLHTRTSWDR